MLFVVLRTLSVRRGSRMEAADRNRPKFCAISDCTLAGGAGAGFVALSAAVSVDDTIATSSGMLERLCESRPSTQLERQRWRVPMTIDGE